MGKAAILSPTGDLHVELTKETLQPGDLLEGNVYLHLPEAIEAATLKLHILGRQGLNWLTTRGHGVVAHGNAITHLSEEMMLAEDIAFTEGDAVFPFSFQLPDELQHNFVFVSRQLAELQGVRVNVKYEVLAELNIPRGSNLDAKTAFKIDPLPLAVPFGRRVEATTEDTVKFLSMMNRGTVRAALSIDTDVLDASSTVEARITLDLKTPQSLKYIMLVLYEKAIVDRHNPLFTGKRIGTRRMCCRQLDKAAIDLQTNNNTDSMTLTMQLPLSPNELSELDEPMLPSMSSFFVDITYCVALEVKFPMTPRIKVEVPVTLIEKLVAPQELEVATVA